MVKIDNYYKFVGASFGLAYFIGLTIALIYILLGASYPVPESFTGSLHLTSQIYFKTTYLEMSNTSFSLAIIPFSYLIEAVNYGFTHMVLLTSSFLGQIKLFVQLLPQLLFFLSFIIFSTIGLKAVLYIIKNIVNYLLQKKDKYRKLELNIFTTDDIIFCFIGILSLLVGTLFQLKLIKIMFIFLINFKAITIVLILLLYIILILISGYTLYNLGYDVYNELNKK